MANHSKMLSEIFCSVLENQAYMFGEPIEEGEEIPPASGDYLQARMRFMGPFRGELSLTVPAEVCPEIAANVLGLEPDDERVAESSEDALKELLNVTCGQVLTALAGEDPVFDLTVPEVKAVDDGQWESLLASSDTAAFIVEDAPVLLHLDTEGDISE